MHFTTAIFDMDGTLFDTERIAIDAWQEAFGEIGQAVPRRELEAVIGVDGPGTRAHLSTLMPVHVSYDDVRDLAVEIRKGMVDQHGIPLKPGAWELLDYLESNGIAIGLATSTYTERAFDNLNRTGITGYFRVVVGGDQVDRAKPFPDIYLKALRELRATAKDAIALEDSEPGIRAAHGAGLRVIHVPDILRIGDDARKCVHREYGSLLEFRDEIAVDKSKPTTNPAELWNAKYRSRRGRDFADGSDPWLERWSGLLEHGRRGRVLELGCGGGRDSRILTGLGLDLIASDYSDEALAICRQQAPLAEQCRIDLREPLPFFDSSFPLVLASLCLHYFHWPATMAIMAEIYRCLQPGGYLLARVNSTRDIRHGAVGHEEVAPHLFLKNGELKRFFDRSDLELLIGQNWIPHDLEEITVDRYAFPKVLWEFVVEKPASDGCV